MSEVADRFIQAFQAGHQSKLAQEEHDQRMADSKLTQTLLKHKVDELKLQDQLAARNLAVQNAQLMQGQPGRTKTAAADLGTGITPTADVPANYDQTGAAPPDLQSVLANRQVQLQGSPTPAVLERTTMPHDLVTIPGVDAFNGAPATPEVSIQPQTREELDAEKIADMVAASRVKRMENTYTINTPSGPVTVPKEAVGPVITGAGANARAAEANKSREQIAADNRAAAARLAAAGQAAAEKRANIRAGATTGAAQIRAAGQGNKEAQNALKFWQQNTLAANKRMELENRAAITAGNPISHAPSGTELAGLYDTQEGPGVRRWGSGAKMPIWLAKQYMQQAGSKEEAMRAAQADGWDTRVP